MIVHAKKSLGQNFLINQGIIDTIVSSCQIRDEIIVEVGPGQWAITKKILEQGPKSLHLIELDDRLIPLLSETFAWHAEIHHGDVLKSHISPCDADITITFESQKIEEQPWHPGYIVFGNIPYYITSPIISHFLHSHIYKPKKLIFMMQKEVASKILKSDTKNSVLSLACELACKKISKVTDVSPGSFSPPPKVHSTVLMFELYDAVETGFNAKVLKLIHAWFSQKRKKLMNNLQSQYHGISKEAWEQIFSKSELPLNIRAEDVDVNVWRDMMTHIETISQ